MRAAGPRRRGDLTQGPIARTLLVFALPQIAGNVMQTLNGSINAIWVGRLLGERALAATANANLVMFLLFALSFGLGMAATVRIGAVTASSADSRLSTPRNVAARTFWSTNPSSRMMAAR